MKILITGINGFVGSYLREHLLQQKQKVFGTSRSYSDKFVFNTDLMDKQNLKEIIISLKPDIIFHLAAQSSVKKSWEDKYKTFQTNFFATLTLLETIKELELSTRVVTIGSAEEYGITNGSPVTEDSFMNPINPYGLSKMAVGYLVKQFFSAYQLNVVHIRAFPHIGPGQNSTFVTQDFSKQIALIERGEQEARINVGNIDVIRDFTDVRDVVKAYWIVAMNGRAGEIYNVSSGEGISLKDILKILVGYSKKSITVNVDPQKFRPADIPILIGSNHKLKALGWEKEIPIEKTLLDILDQYRSKLE
ncbi:GDP-mannose 4,6-dehydratase [Paenibacillus turpanensis]|uniref:GDP-mannose 4,6-dehydratase n=1 Tax=Paenibacillus turpanensis TaxID=2689078 RepID=UPI001408CFA8|nr:GDP-mannose 4,6-dehydratase [Paenibacillus turpanensis]